MSRYAVWNKVSNVVTPSGAIFTPEQWIEKYPIAELVDTVCGGGVVNGAYFGIYEDMVTNYASQGCDYTGCETQQDYLDAIEAFEDARNAESQNYIPTEERIAAALEAQTMMQMDDVEE